MPLSLTTRIGHAMVASYEMIFTQPDSVTYSKTGMLFGAELVSKSTDFLSRNPEIANLFQDYVQNCVMGDIYLNHKYTLEELMASADPYTLIFSRPSPLRGVYDSNNNFVTCKDASVSLKDKLNLDTQSGGKTWHYYAQQLFGGRPDPNLLFSTLIGDSYSYFYGSSKSASQIIRQNVTINALKEGITSYAARNGDSASLVNLATTSSMEKQRLAHVSIGHVAMRTLPMTQTILTGIAIGIFPLLVLDHANRILHLDQTWMFLAGRGAFPLFALVWGLNLSRHAHIRQSAINRLWGWGIIAQFAYYLAGFPWYEGNILFAFAVAAQVLTWCETPSRWRFAGTMLLLAVWLPFSGTSYGIAGLLMLAVSHRLYRAEDRMERLVVVACLLAVIPALNLATSDAAAVAGLVMTELTVGLVSCAGKSLPRFWPGDFFPTFYACHLAVLGVLAL
ncbi:type-F conjugative transfer system pilin acetylase TraX [Escherichia coli]|nr:type-F conjugative transfer system pilin acetylase TraX [Escherichia coli]EFH6510312.1 type-F conjugative transfer system pilin acetylase TraX [Escherichia coli]